MLDQAQAAVRSAISSSNEGGAATPGQRRTGYKARAADRQPEVPGVT